jgi:hypothetical protein
MGVPISLGVVIPLDKFEAQRKSFVLRLRQWCRLSCRVLEKSLVLLYYMVVDRGDYFHLLLGRPVLYASLYCTWLREDFVMLSIIRHLPLGCRHVLPIDEILLKF